MTSDREITVNNYPCKVYQAGELEIQVNLRRLEVNEGRVYLTILELREMLALAEESAQEQGPQTLSRQIRDAVLSEAQRQLDDLGTRTGLNDPNGWKDEYDARFKEGGF